MWFASRAAKSPSILQPPGLDAGSSQTPPGGTSSALARYRGKVFWRRNIDRVRIGWRKQRGRLRLERREAHAEFLDTCYAVILQYRHGACNSSNECSRVWRSVRLI